MSQKGYRYRLVVCFAILRSHGITRWLPVGLWASVFSIVALVSRGSFFPQTHMKLESAHGTEQSLANDVQRNKEPGPDGSIFSACFARQFLLPGWLAGEVRPVWRLQCLLCPSHGLANCPKTQPPSLVRKGHKCEGQAG